MAQLLGLSAEQVACIHPFFGQEQGVKRVDDMGDDAQHLASEVAALPLTQVQPQGTPFAVADPIELAGHAPLGATNQAGAPPLLRLDALRWALSSVASIISTSGSMASDGSVASDADNLEKVRSKTPLSDQRRQRL